MKLKELIETKDVVHIENVYLPYLGKCVLSSSFFFDEATDSSNRAKILNNEREEEEGTRYDLTSLVITIDFDNRKVSGGYRKQWIGGLVEEHTFEYPFEVTRSKQDDASEMYEMDISVKE